LNETTDDQERPFPDFAKVATKRTRQKSGGADERQMAVLLLLAAKVARLLRVAASYGEGSRKLLLISAAGEAS
jgi:hypothetical protein